MLPVPSRASRAAAALLAAICLLAPAAAATGGDWRLLDADGQSLAGARVSVIGRSGSVVTADEGLFTLVPEPTPPFELIVADGRGAWLGVIRVTEPPATRPSVVRLGRIDRIEVTLREGVAPTTISPPAAAATLVSREDAAERMPARLVDALDEVPGATRVGSGAASVPALRGLSGGRTLLLVDDARVSTERRAGPSATFLDPFTIENIEVVRGPGSVAYGSDALGGVIHVRTPRPRPGETSGRFEVGAAAPTPQSRAAVEFNVPAGRGALLGQLHARSFDNYDAPGGEVPNSAAEDRGVLLRGLWPLGGAVLQFGLQVDRADDLGKPTLDDGPQRTFYPRETSNRLTLELDLPGRGGWAGLEIDAFVGDYRLVTDQETFDPGGTTSVERSEIEATDAALRFVAGRALGSGLLRVGLDARGRYGLDARDAAFERDAAGAVTVTSDSLSVDGARGQNLGLFAEIEGPFAGGAVELSAGLRGETMRTRNSGGFFGDRSTSDEALSGYAAASVEPWKRTELTLQVARGFREPRLSDRYFRGVTGRGTITGNPDLLPESAMQYDFAMRTTFGRFRIATHGYVYRIDDLIERFRPTPGVDDFAFRNRGEADVRGVEVETRLTLARGLTTNLALNWSRGESRDDGAALSDIPPRSAVLGIDQRLPRFWWRARLAAYAGDDDPGPTERVLPGYAVVDASTGLSLGERLELRLLLYNLFDRAYPASADDDTVVASGRTSLLVLAGTF